MLQAQVNYWTLMENTRHNQEMEKQGWTSLEEQKRHNFQSEKIDFIDVAERQRHNRTTEEQNIFAMDTARISANAAAKNADTNADRFEFDKTFDSFKHTDDYNLKSRELDIREQELAVQQQNADTKERTGWSEMISGAGRLVGDFIRLIK